MDGAGRYMRAVLCLAAFTGLRAIEIAGLSWADVQLDDAQPYIRVLGKGSKERMLDLSPIVVEALRALPNRRGPVIVRANGALGFNTASRVSQRANEYLHAVGVPDSLHALRHRFATEICRVAGVRVAADALGHASVSTTMIYTKVLRTDTRAAVLAVGHVLTEPAPAPVTDPVDDWGSD